MLFNDEHVELKHLVNERDIALQLADYTNRDPAISAELERLNSLGLPTVAIYSPDAEPVVFNEMVTEEQLIAALQTAIENRTRR